MIKSLYTLFISGLLLAAIGSTGQESSVKLIQTKKPTQTLRDLVSLQEDLLERFDRDLRDGKVQSYDWDDRLEVLRKRAEALASKYSPADWQTKDEEVLALAVINQYAERFDLAAEGFRFYLDKNPEDFRIGAIDIRSSLTRALIETGRLEEAGKVLDESYATVKDNPAVVTSRITLQKELAIALRDEMRLTEAARRAETAYRYADKANREILFGNRLRESTLRDQLTLAAIFIAVNERLNRPKEASDFKRIVERYDFTTDPILKSFYRDELFRERLIGRPAPELEVERWLDSDPLSLSALRGKVVLLDFWAMWCGPCIGAFPHLRDFHARYAGRGLQIIGVTRLYGRSDLADDLTGEQELKSLDAYRRKYQLPYPIAVGKMDDVANEEKFSVKSLPMVILIDRQGRIRHFKQGIGEYRQLERRLNKLIEEQQLR